MKLVHCADLHLDSPFSGLDSSKAVIRKEDIKSTFGRIIELVKEEKADALLISGDLFDGDFVSKHTIDFLISKFSEIKQTCIFIAAGNHDPKSSKSYYNLIDWGENVHIFDTTLEVINYKGVNFAGISMKNKTSDEQLVSPEELKNIHSPSVLVMHSNYSGAGYNPLSKDDISKSGITYFASGHIHKSFLEKMGDTLFCYPGCPEGRGFDELGEKGVFVAEICENEANARFVPLASREYIEVKADVSGLISYDSIAGKIKKDIHFSSSNLYKIVLEGEAEFEINPDVLLGYFDAFYIKIYDKTSPKIDYDALADDFSITGLFVKKMLEKIKTEGETEELKNALKFGLSAIRGEKVNP